MSERKHPVDEMVEALKIAFPDQEVNPETVKQMRDHADELVVYSEVGTSQTIEEAKKWLESQVGPTQDLSDVMINGKRIIH